MGIFDNSSKFGPAAQPQRQRQSVTNNYYAAAKPATTRDRYGNRISDNSGYVVSVRSRGQGVNSRSSRALMRQKKTESDAKNSRLEAIMKAQRVKQAALMQKSRDQISKTGAARRTQIQEGGVRAQGQAQQNLTSRGLGNTTIVDSVRRGIDSDTNRRMTGQRDLEAGRMADTYSREAGMQTSQGQFQLQGEGQMSGGLEEYIALLQQLGGGLS